MSEIRIVTNRFSRIVLSAAAILVLLSSSQPAAAKGLSGEIAELRSRWSALRNAAQWDGEAEQRLVTDIDSVVGRARVSGVSSDAAAALRALLVDAHGRYRRWIAQRREAIIAADGDLEAAQDAPEWRAREELALRTLYHLNWVYLEAATRYEPRSPRRREWLRSAARGFGEFIGVEGDPGLTAESLYGRGQCRRALDEPEKAAADFRAALKVPAAEELAPRVRAALIETLVDLERIDEALTVSRDLLRSHRSGEAEFLRAKVLLLALASRSGSEARRRGYRSEVTDCAGRLEKRGGKWARLSRQLIAAGITRPEEWLDQGDGSTIQWVVAESLRGRGKCAEAIPLYEKLIDSTAQPAPETLLALGACQFDVAAYAAAYVTLTRIDVSAPGGDAIADAAYLRFKAAEALDHSAATKGGAHSTAGQSAAGAESARRLERAVRDYLAAFPDHAQAFEAYYRLGEIERARGNLAPAVAAFDAVAGDSTFHLQAVFQAAQCSVEQAEKQAAASAAAGGGSGRSETQSSAALAQEALRRLRKYLAESEAFRRRSDGAVADAVMLAPMDAHARVLGAVLLTNRGGREDLQEALSWLEQFEERYPQQSELHSQVNALRAIALLGLERFAAAQVALRAFIASPRHGERDYRLLRQLGVQSLELAEQQRNAGHADSERALRQQALSVYEELLRAAEAGELPGESAAGLRGLVEDLKSRSVR